MAKNTKPALFRTQFKALGGPCDIQLFAPESHCAHLFELARQELQRIECKYSRYLATSFISELNAQAGKTPVPIDEETQKLFEVADMLFEQSNGAFDITSGVYRKTWPFGSDRNMHSKANTSGPEASALQRKEHNELVPPNPQQLAELAHHVGWTKVQRQGNTVFFPDPAMQIDLGGIGKEYAADRLGEILNAEARAQGLRLCGLINLGGDVVALGKRPDGRPWQLGIQHPRKPGKVLATLDLAGQALATSGDYERYFMLAGRRYSHVLDARTGWPVSYWQSVSVVAPSCLVAGSLTSLAMVLQAKGLHLLKASGFDFFAVGPNGQVHSR
jgi:thiamine biosynthesis lipoprotein